MSQKLLALNELTDFACENIERLLEELEISYYRSGRRLMGCCPCHDSDNRTAWNFYPDGESVRGIWQCHTNSCHLTYGKSLLGLIKGVLSFQQNRECGNQEAISYLLAFCGYKNIEEVKIPNQNVLTKRYYNGIIKKLNLKGTESLLHISREDFRKKVEIPPKFYLNQNYSRRILDKYDVGIYNKVGRILIPIYDDTHSYILGCVSRTIFDKCGECNYYHKDGLCPQTEYDRFKCVKWLTSKGFPSDSYLFNYWFAKYHIQKSKVIILTEGPGDVLRLEEGGIHNSLAIFGSELKDKQKLIIDQTGAMSIIVMLDNDKAGITGSLNIKKKLSRSYRLYFPKIKSDPGNLHTDEITRDIKPLIEKVKNNGN